MIIVQYTFSLLGALIRFIIVTPINLILKKDFISFKKIWKGSNYKKKSVNNEMVNTIIGASIFFILASMIIRNNW